ncbi:hypothetical protein [Cellulomonas fimi]|uniref:Uncharacterized protein n=1 Tax=Cellulomonas fimi (strain ATCC 484 / DSM 20113 / JCM 1341 / CCUG 24087 / LMG 16345 / NBRC 15513 / NCIMB 8980 / NCTC 7547 / NRS-133) TaxID=590998 RepID=F4GYG4_CELFA|nr:hypothetical protein [Cellulomonas fimi]AEE45953.1 hypothetical protein Celf_1823 [Cellulomonas fimi ATCC 484]NNH06539.1 hypothetical protein [Cellulomonas fimi]VEH31101.1 Uncharacterised protein [Cellulomonas fimi]
MSPHPNHARRPDRHPSAPSRAVRARGRHLRRCAVALTGLAAGLALLAPPATGADRFLDIHGTATCDSEHGQWVVTWALTNHAEVAGTFGNVRAYPASRPLVGLPDRIQPGQTVTAEQRLLATEHSGEILLDVNWDDGVVTYDHHWPVYIKTHCAT